MSRLLSALKDKEPEPQDDPIAPARGIANGVALSVVFWIAVAFIVLIASRGEMFMQRFMK
jgi:hypothetical protein